MTRKETLGGISLRVQSTRLWIRYGFYINRTHDSGSVLCIWLLGPLGFGQPHKETTCKSMCPVMALSRASLDIPRTGPTDYIRCPRSSLKCSNGGQRVPSKPLPAALERVPAKAQNGRPLYCRSHLESQVAPRPRAAWGLPLA